MISTVSILNLKSEISNEEISLACWYIHFHGQCNLVGPTDIYQSFNTLGGNSILDKGIDICVETLNEQELTKISERIIQWARAQDLQASIESKTLVQKYSYNIDIVWHLACLALTGKIDVLKSYQFFLEVGTISEYLESNIVKKSVKYAVEFAEKHLKILHERETTEARLAPQVLITFNKVAEQLKQMGWTVYRDKNYNRNAYFISKDRIINIVYELNKEGETPLVFSTAYRHIFPSRPQYISPQRSRRSLYSF